MEPELLVARTGDVVELTLNRPDKLNSFNTEMHVRLREAFDMIESDATCRAVLLTGAGRGFCAGQDLNARSGAGGVDLGDTLGKTYNPLIRRMRTLPKPIICAVNGVAAGAGANFALACDIVIAAKSAKFIQAFVKIGLVPDAGGTFFLPRFIGDARARALALTGEAISAEKAADWGLIWKAVDDAELMTHARGLSAHLATQPTQAIARIKKALAAAAVNDLDGQLEIERTLQREAGRTPDFREGVTAFLEKRAPKFTGRPE